MIVRAKLWLRIQADTRLRFLVAGGLAAGINWLVRFPLDLVMSFEIAVIVAMAIGMLFGFVMYRSWVFVGWDRSLAQQIRDFVVINILGMIVTAVMAVLARDAFLYLSFAETPAEASGHAVGILIGALTNFLGHRHVTFRSSNPADRNSRSANIKDTTDR